MGGIEPVTGARGDARRALFDFLFPGRCVLCGQWLRFEPGADAPVCHSCVGALVPIHGARCARCGMALISEIGICTRCREAVYAFESNIALFPFAGAPRKLIVALKFEGRSRLAALFASLVSAALVGERAAIPVVPVPSRPGRKTPGCRGARRETPAERSRQNGAEAARADRWRAAEVARLRSAQTEPERHDQAGRRQPRGASRPGSPAG